MIEVSSLSKQYAGRVVVDDLSFSVDAGQCVGFLGPNGAGKSTTMRILAGYLSPSGGTARVNGFDLFHQSNEARRSIGYMPENAPLYLDMRVKEYLGFRGRLKGLRGSDLRRRQGEVLEACGLTASRRKIISTLSKGFRQRVALADALISRPPLLILDEPSNGLDPLQMRHVRELLADLRPKQTILLSTHLLGEVEQSCDRVLLLHRGRLCADDSPQNLVRKLRAVTDVKVELQGQGPFEEELAGINGVRKVMAGQPDGSWRPFVLRAEAQTDIRDAIFELALKRHWHVRELHRELPGLEDVFVELTEGA